MSWKNKNVLITGISGFAGAYLAQNLLEKGANIFGLIRNKSDTTLSKNITSKGIENLISIIRGDILDIYSLASCMDSSEPDVIFHLAAQSFVPRSISQPLETLRNNSVGTANLLEVVRMKNIDPVIVFAGSSEEYGLVASSEEQWSSLKTKYKTIFPEPNKIPEIPISELNPLRPMSPYAVSKVQGDFLFRNYNATYGMKTIVSRAFNHEGAGRGDAFVTSVITNQVMQIKKGLGDKIVIGNVNAFRDWSHVKDIVDGYCLLAEKGNYGDVYNQGSMRTNSVLTYIMHSLEAAGYQIERLRTIEKRININNPGENDKTDLFGVNFVKTKIDRMLLENELSFGIKDKGIIIETNKGEIKVEFNPMFFRSSEVPILMSDTSKIKKIGFKTKYSIKDIIMDQLNFYL